MINLNKKVQLETVTTGSPIKLVYLIQYNYPPAYKHLWKNEDCRFYFDTFYNLEYLQKELLGKTCRIQLNKLLKNLRPETYIHRIYIGIEAQEKGIAKTIFKWIKKKSESKYQALFMAKSDK